MATRKNPVARVGNYAQEVDPATLDPEMSSMMFGKKMDKTESAYVKGKKNSPTAIEAVRRARKANKAAPLKIDE